MYLSLGMFGLSGRVLECFRSYLEQHSQRVSVRGILSDIQFLLSGVPEGSVLVPLVFTMYTRPLGLLSRDNGLNITSILMTHSCIYHWILTMS